jgi:hypothetical protein
LKEGTVVDANERFAAIAANTYSIPNKYTECQGFHESPQCSSVCRLTAACLMKPMQKQLKNYWQRKGLHV